MVFAHLRSSAGLSDRIFAKLAKIPTQPMLAEVFPFAAALWPQGRRENTRPVLQFSSALLTPSPVESKSVPEAAPELVAKPEFKPVPMLKPLLQLPSAQLKIELKTEEPPKSTVPALQPQQLGEFQIPSREIIRANRVVEVQRRHVDLVNQRQPYGCHVMAWSMIPAEIWQGANATFMMMACDFFHASAANSLLLPVTRKGADHLKLPQYPFHAAHEMIEAARADVSKIREAFAAEHQQVLQAMQRGDMSALSNRPARKKKFADDLKSLAHRLAAAQFGKNILQDHQTAFGDALNYETPQPL